MKRDAVIRCDISLKNLIGHYKEKKQEELGTNISDVQASRIFVKEFFDSNINEYTKVTIGEKERKFRDKLFNL